MGLTSFIVAPVFLASIKNKNRFSTVKKFFAASIISTISLGVLIVLAGGNLTRTCMTLVAYAVAMLGLLHFGSQKYEKATQLERP